MAESNSSELDIDGNAFTYPTRLTTADDYIRVLRPTEFTKQRLAFEVLVSKRRSRRPGFKYTAISYTWGEEELIDTIFLDGKPFPVRPNLWTCLYCLCQNMKKSGWRYIWVDAICINQADEAEKSAQVSAMGQTYSAASCVSVWLGLPRGVSGFSLSSGDWRSTSQPPDSPKSLEALCIHPFSKACAMDIDTTQDKEPEAEMLELADRAYWTRRWVIQEFLLAQRIQIYCGEFSVDDGDFKARIGGSILSQLVSSSSAYNKTAARALIDAKELTVPYKSTLRHLLDEHSSTQCRDARDRAFALLALANDAEWLKTVLPDYTMRMGQVVVLVLVYRMRARAERAPRTVVYTNNGDQDFAAAIGWPKFFQAAGFDHISQEYRHFLFEQAIIEFERQRSGASNLLRDS